MKLSPKVRYAVRMLFELAQSDVPLSLAAMSEKTGVSLRAMENVHTILKQNGVTDGAVGAKGGIRLQRSLEDVSLGELVAWLDDGVEFSVCCGDKANECPNRGQCETSRTWGTVSTEIQQLLNTISLQSILRQFSSNTISPPQSPPPRV